MVAILAMAESHSQTYDMIIIGGGIIGSAFAYEAAQRSIGTVLLIDDASSAPALDSATAQSWAWVNAATDNNHAYFNLRYASMKQWDAWIAREPALMKTAIGGFLWDLPEAELANYITTHKNWGYPVTAMASDEVKTALPFLRTPPALAAFCEAEFALEPVATAKALRDASGAEVISGTVDRLILEGDEVQGVQIGTQTYHGAEIIMAAGIRSEALLATCDIALPLAPTNGLLITTKPIAKLTSYLLTAPDYHFRQMADGALLIGGRFNQDAKTIESEADRLAAAKEILSIVEAACSLPERLEIAYVTNGTRVIPADGLPVIGRFARQDGTKISGLYGAIMHSGVSNAAGVAHYAIDEMLSQRHCESLAPYHPTRFIQKSKAS